MSDVKTTLYKHLPLPHPHKPTNINDVHEAEMRSPNARIAVFLTKHVGTMWTAYAFTVLAVIGLAGILNLLPAIVILLCAWLSQEFIQLVLLPVIMVGQNVLSRKQELQADEQFNTTMKTYHDIESIMNDIKSIIDHLGAQDTQILDIATKVEQMEKIEQSETLKQTDMLETILAMLSQQQQGSAKGRKPV